MTTTVEDLLAKALSLSPEDRARLAERLIASFEPRPAAQAPLMQVSKARRDEVRAGKAETVPGDEVLARIRARIG